MSTLIERLKNSFTPVETLEPGIYHYQAPSSDPRNYRLHLRVESDGSALLVINASTVLHLNQTAAEYAYHLIKQTPIENITEKVASRYRGIDKNGIKDDYTRFEEQINFLIDTPDLDPVTFLDMERHLPYSEAVSAPYRLDCALTYRLPEGSHLESAPTKRVDRELNTDEWKQVIDKAWGAGIPHILFTGGEPTLRDDLPDLIAHAEKNGQVTGLITDGLRLADSGYLNRLLQAGLDHTMIILHPNRESTWESLASFTYWTETLDEDIFVAAHLTLTKDNVQDSLQLLNKLTEAGVSAISLSENDKSLSEQLQLTREHADAIDLGLVWDLPVPYSDLNPVALELEMEDERHPDGAGSGWLYVEPDGDVLPGQGINIVLGNILTDEWTPIWENARAVE